MSDMVECMIRTQARSVNSSNTNNEWYVNTNGNVNNNNANNNNRLAPIALHGFGLKLDHRKRSQTIRAMQGVCAPSARRTIAG